MILLFPVLPLRAQLLLPTRCPAPTCPPIPANCPSLCFPCLPWHQEVNLCGFYCPPCSFTATRWRSSRPDRPLVPPTCMTRTQTGRCSQYILFQSRLLRPVGTANPFPGLCAFQEMTTQDLKYSQPTQWQILLVIISLVRGYIWICWG